MINEKEYRLHREIIDWMVQNGMQFMEAVSIVSYSHKTDTCLVDATFDLTYPRYNVQHEEVITP